MDNSPPYKDPLFLPEEEVFALLGVTVEEGDIAEVPTSEVTPEVTGEAEPEGDLGKDEEEGLPLTKIDPYGDLSEVDDVYEAPDVDDEDLEEEEDYSLSQNGRKYPAKMKRPPKDLEDFFTREEERVRRLATKFGIPLEEQDDFWMEVVLKFHREGTLGKYDPSRKAKWPTFLYRVIHNFADHFRSGLKRDAVRNAASIVDFRESGGENQLAKGTVFMDHVSLKQEGADPVKTSVIPRLADRQLGDYLEWGLPWARERFCYGDWVTDLLESSEDRETVELKKGQVVLLLDRFENYLRGNRPWAGEQPPNPPHKLSLKQPLDSVFRLLRAGMKQGDIAKELGISTGSVTNYKNRLRAQAAEFMGQEVC